MANDTGGFLVRGTNELAVGLRRMLEDNDTYYLMAYEPANTKRDGKFRKIEVRLPRRSGLVVRTRKGYLAPDDRNRPERLAATGPTVGPVAAPALDEAEARTALASPIPPNGTPLRLVVDYLDLPPAGSQVIVGAHVNLARLNWRQAGGRRQVDFELVGGAYDANGGPVGPPFGKRVSLDLTPAEQERAMKGGFQYQNRLVLAPGRFDVRVIAREPSGATLGGAVQRVEIPDLRAGELALSSVFLSTADATATPAGGDSEALRDVQTLRRFKPGDSLYFQLYVYNVAREQRGSERRRAPGPDPLRRQADRRVEAPADRAPEQGRRAVAAEQRNEPGGIEPRALRAADRGRGPQGRGDGPPGRGLQRGVSGRRTRVRAA